MGNAKRIMHDNLNITDVTDIHHPLITLLTPNNDSVKAELTAVSINKPDNVIVGLNDRNPQCGLFD